ncbi:MAG: hypothetical protein JSS10_00640 [Verrucomicrobia bacterium]|nr:hypothetical protein [Verrucomicrobiota bacterium]
MAADTVRLFAKLGIPDCPIGQSPIANPLFADCNEASVRVDLMDKICQAIFEARKNTQSDPAWYVDNKIRFDEAMTALNIPPEIRNKIGPHAPLFKRLLTAEGVFNKDGLHIYERENLINWVYVNLHGRCPECTQPSRTSFSKAYFCFIQYQNPHQYLADPEIEKTFQTEGQKRQQENQSLTRAQKIQNVFTKIESGTQIYIVPFFVFIFNISYFLRSCDILFSTDLTSKFGEKVSFLAYILSLLDHIDTAQILWTLYRTGERQGNAGFTVLQNLIGSQILLRRAPSLLWKSFVLYYTAQKAISFLPSSLLQHRYLQVIGRIHHTGFEYVTDLALRIDSYVQHPIRRWLFPCVRYAVRTILYSFAVYTVLLLMESRPVVDSLMELAEAVCQFLVLLVNSCNNMVIFPILYQWEIIKNMSLILAAGQIAPMRGSYFFLYKIFVNFIAWLAERTYLLRGFACYAVIRDLCWMFNLPNPVRYLPYGRNLENSAVLNL